MKLPLLDVDKKKSGEKELPAQFNEEYRPDLISRAVHAVQSANRQRYGAFPDAGQRHSSRISKRRRNWRGSYGFGISRVNRKILSHRGTRFGWVGAFSPQTRGGRRSHPPKAEKILEQKINHKENQKAIRSAMGATVHKELVVARGHRIPADYPFILSSKIESITKTKDVTALLQSLGFEQELVRSAEKRVRAGRGKVRGRKYRRKKGVLIVVGDTCALLKSGMNVPGVDIVKASALNAALLAPGTLAGRVTLWTEHALEVIAQEKLFM